MQTAAELARIAGLPEGPFRTSWPLPPGAVFLAADDTLGVVVERNASPETMTTVMAHGLAHAGDRDLHLVVPDAHAWLVRSRAAFLQPKVRVSGYTAEQATPAPPPARTEVLRAAATPPHIGATGLAPEDQRRRAAETGVHLGLTCCVPTAGPGAVLLGADTAGDLHVVATAAPEDDALVLRALDAWLWAAGERSARATLADLREDCRVRLTIAQAGGEPAMSPYAPALLEALDGVAVCWRIVRLPADGSPEIAVGDWWRLPSWAAPRQRPAPPRWPVRLATAQRAAAPPSALTRGVAWASADKAIHPRARPVYERLRDLGLLHHGVLRLVSSQAFAINLFGPLGGDATRELFAVLGLPVQRAEPPLLEYTDPADRLSEASAASPHLTQVDVLLRGVTAAGEPVAGLVEVKLTEPDFGGCSAYQDPENDRRHVCRVAAPFGGEPAACFQLRRRDPDHPPRRYAQVLDLPGRGSTTTPDGGCPFRGGNQQMRNVAVAAAMRQSGEVTHAVVALCAPAGYRSIWRRWAEACEVLDGVPGVTLGRLPAETVLEVTTHPEADLVRRRHLEPARQRADSSDDRAGKQLIDLREARSMPVADEALTHPHPHRRTPPWWIRSGYLEQVRDLAPAGGLKDRGSELAELASWLRRRRGVPVVAGCSLRADGHVPARPPTRGRGRRVLPHHTAGRPIRQRGVHRRPHRSAHRDRRGQHAGGDDADPA
ncbi:PGN_0703 family putative restriction endonuclease [Actinoplanes hulinensis]|uniref:PGN_0703 family putative restriction endonuclease n=1 Tax=Actinoplanes hulinensis TaxID=1144547 RepID=UPI003556947E